MTFQQIVKRLQDRSTRVVAKATGLTEQTVSGIKTGKRTNPTLETLQRLQEYFEIEDYEKTDPLPLVDEAIGYLENLAATISRAEFDLLDEGVRYYGAHQHLFDAIDAINYNESNVVYTPDGGRAPMHSGWVNNRLREQLKVALTKRAEVK